MLFMMAVLMAGCTLAPANPTPTAAIPTSDNTASPLPTATHTATLLPTPTNAATATAALPTPMIVSSPAGGGGAFAFGSTGGTGTGNNNSTGVAPIGVREQPGTNPATPAQITVSTPENALTPTVPPRFNDRYPARVPANSTLVVTYDINLTGGVVVVWVVSPTGEVIWQEGFTETIKDESDISIENAGEYEIFTYANNLRGYFSVGYDLR